MALLSLDDGRQISLTSAGGTVYRGSIKLEKDGAYHVATHERSQVLRISDDYFIEAGPVKPPEVALVRPERDYRASPIEEVTLGARARGSLRPERIRAALFGERRSREDRQSAEGAGCEERRAARR